MGNTCKPMAVLFQCMTKFTTNKKKKKIWSLLSDLSFAYCFTSYGTHAPSILNSQPILKHKLSQSAHLTVLSTVLHPSCLEQYLAHERCSVNIGWILWTGFPDGSDGKESACNTGHPGSIPGLGRLPGEGNGYPLQYSCLENSIDRGAWQATVHEVTESDVTWATHTF